MAQSDNKVLILGALAGVAGLGLAVACYQGFSHHRRRHSMPAPHLRTPRSELVPGLMLVDGPGGLSSGQVEVLNRLEALIQCVSELKEEMKALKRALPTLPEAVRGELRGPRRISPLHRAPGDHATALFEKIDRLHQGSESDKHNNILTFCLCLQLGQNSAFLWRLTRAYSDVHDFCGTLEEKKEFAENGKSVGEEAVQLNPTCADSHQWYAIMCGIMAEYDTVQNKIKNGYIFKDHLDKAIELKPHDPLSYYLLGRWCYAVAQLSWLERKVAATLFGEPPSASVEDALKNFLKVHSSLSYLQVAERIGIAGGNWRKCGQFMWGLRG
uniref:Regulator of microtubule dynamics protein 2 n=1 Tax=Neogobius melanostomus TaxID=47308 RepID=A0A8C6UN80_9GOBI